MTHSSNNSFSCSGPLVINWHVTQACNYRCDFCYAAWRRSDGSKEIFHDVRRSEQLLKELHAYFCGPDYAHHSGHTQETRGIRLNIAGGEPLLYPGRVHDIAQTACSMGMDVSLITNGSRLDPAWLQKTAPYLAVLGVSLDSADHSINQAIGRVDRFGRTADLAQLVSALDEARRNNPALQIKVNTVVSRYNWNIDLTEALLFIRPSRWKVLRMLPVVNGDSKVSDHEFQFFVERHQAMVKVISIEDNDDMTESYIRIDPFGRFYQNSATGGDYVYSRPILEAGAAEAFKLIRFEPQKFASRYTRGKSSMGA